MNHLDISPRFAGILMAFTNCLANLTGLLAPIVAGYIIEGKVSIHTRITELLHLLVVPADFTYEYQHVPANFLSRK